MSTNTTLPVSLIQLRLGEWFGGFRNQMVVPNVSWGLLNHECDLIICSKTGYLTEVEIKRSWSDFLADFRKCHRHDDDDRIRSFYYAVPESITDRVMAHLRDLAAGDPSFVMPAVLYYTEDGRIGYVNGSGAGSDWSRGRKTRPLDKGQMAHLAHLGCMRLFAVTEKLIDLQDRYDRAVKRLGNGDTDTKAIRAKVKETEAEIKKTDERMRDAQFERRHNHDLSDEERQHLEDEFDRLERWKYGKQEYLEALQDTLTIINNKQE